MTNFEKIQSMDIKEFVNCFRNCDLCDYIRQEDFKWCSKRVECEGCHEEWLSKEVE